MCQIQILKLGGAWSSDKKLCSIEPCKPGHLKSSNYFNLLGFSMVLLTKG